jgi:hypothetical protein
VKGIVQAHGGRLWVESRVGSGAGCAGRAIVTKGLRVFVRDAEADHAYVRDVQLRAADLAPWLRRLRRRKLEALRR